VGRVLIRDSELEPEDFYICSGSSETAQQEGEGDGTLLAEGESVHLVAGSDNRAKVLPDDLLALIQRI